MTKPVRTYKCAEKFKHTEYRNRFMLNSFVQSDWKFGHLVIIISIIITYFYCIFSSYWNFSLNGPL